MVHLMSFLSSVAKQDLRAQGCQSPLVHVGSLVTKLHHNQQALQGCRSKGQSPRNRIHVFPATVLLLREQYLRSSILFNSNTCFGGSTGSKMGVESEFHPQAGDQRLDSWWRRKPLDVLRSLCDRCFRGRKLSPKWPKQ